MKDELAGELPVAFVVRSNGSDITEDEIKKYISKQVRITFMSGKLTLKYIEIDLFFIDFSFLFISSGDFLQENSQGIFCGFDPKSTIWENFKKGIESTVSKRIPKCSIIMMVWLLSLCRRGSFEEQIEG
jgi:hypothetical protein